MAHTYLETFSSTHTKRETYREKHRTLNLARMIQTKGKHFLAVVLSLKSFDNM
jgi:hypothetical protein